MKRGPTILVSVLLLALILWTVKAFSGQIAVRLMEPMIAKNMSRNLAQELPDGLHVVVCGSGSPLTDLKRSGPCTAVIAGTRVFVVDAGEGAQETLAVAGLSPARIERVLLTHFHSDHIDGLGGLALQHWAAGASRSPLPLVGPTGVEQIADGLNLVYAQDKAYRIAHHGEAVVPPSGSGLVAQPFAAPPKGPGVVILNEGGLKITAFSVDHEPVMPAVGYRFDYKGRSVVVSGDTARSASLVLNSKDVDLLVHEALSPRLVGLLGNAAGDAGRDNVVKVAKDILTYHTTPEVAADEAKAAGARALLLTHMVPPIPIRALEGPFLGDARKRFEGPLWVANDLDLISLPGGTTEIKKSHIR